MHSSAHGTRLLTAAATSTHTPAHIHILTRMHTPTHTHLQQNKHMFTLHAHTHASPPAPRLLHTVAGRARVEEAAEELPVGGLLRRGNDAHEHKAGHAGQQCRHDARSVRGGPELGHRGRLHLHHTSARRGPERQGWGGGWRGRGGAGAGTAGDAGGASWCGGRGGRGWRRLVSLATSYGGPGWECVCGGGGGEGGGGGQAASEADDCFARFPPPTHTNSTHTATQNVPTQTHYRWSKHARQAPR
jgi:hypothetical protein